MTSSGLNNLGWSEGGGLGKTFLPQMSPPYLQMNVWLLEAIAKASAHPAYPVHQFIPWMP